MRVSIARLLLGLHEISVLYPRGSTWGAVRGLLHSEGEHTSAVIPLQALLCARSACGPMESPSAVSLPGSQVLLRSLLPIVSPPSMNWGLLFAEIRFILTFGFI